MDLEHLPEMPAACGGPVAAGVNDPGHRSRKLLSAIALTPFAAAVSPGGSTPGVGTRPFLAIAGLPSADAHAAIRRALGEAVAPCAAFVGDWDDCFFAEARVADAETWRALLEGNRLAEVTGAFAIAWRDAAGTAVHLARDAAGERTLYYSVRPDALLAASSPRLLLATGLVDGAFDLRAIAMYLACAYVPGASTLHRSIRELLPGERITWSRRRGTIHERFWNLPAEVANPTAEEAALRTELRGLLEAAVRRRLGNDGAPVAATLSGGIDSSLVVALLRSLRPPDSPLHTFSVSFGSGYANELPHSSLVARHCASCHHVVEISPPAVLAHFDETIALLGKPIGDPLTVPNLLLFREAAARAGGAAVFNGEGGDPCFGGPKNQPMLLSELFRGGEDHNAAAGSLAATNADTQLETAAMRRQARARAAQYLRAHGKCFDDFSRMLAPEVAAAVAAHPLEDDLLPWFADGDPRWPHYVTRLQAVNVAFKGAHHILPKVRALAAGAGVLPKSPLFDRGVVEFALRLPARLKLHGAVEKYLLKSAVRDLLPAEIVDRPKSGMLVPVEAWLCRSGPLHAAARSRLLDGLAPRGLVRRDYIEILLDGRLPGLRPRIGAKIWLLLTLEASLRL